MHDTLEALPPLDAETSVDAFLLADDTFDTLLADAVAAGPDSAEAAETLAALVREVMDSGEVDRAMQMAMVLGATACSHPHLEDLANELGEEVMGYTQGQSGHDHAHHERRDRADDKKDKRRRTAGVSLAELLAKYPLLSKSSGQK